MASKRSKRIRAVARGGVVEEEEGGPPPRYLTRSAKKRLKTACDDKKAKGRRTKAGQQQQEPASSFDDMLEAGVSEVTELRPKDLRPTRNRRHCFFVLRIHAFVIRCIFEELHTYIQ